MSRKRGKGLLAIALASAVLCMGTRIANAEVKESSICGYDIWAETYISESIAMARTQCESYDALATVDAEFYYVDRDTMDMEAISDSHAAYYCAIVKMDLPPGNNEAYEIKADHSVIYAVGTEFGEWGDSTSQTLN